MSSNVINSEDNEKTGKVTSAGMYFLHFQVYRLDTTVNALAMAKDPEAAFFKRLEGLQPCEVSELKPGTHIFAVYGLESSVFSLLHASFHGDYCLECFSGDVLTGDNFFKPASYTIEALCAKSYEQTTEKLKEIETQILRKRDELRQFETEYRKVLYLFSELFFILECVILHFVRTCLRTHLPDPTWWKVIVEMMKCVICKISFLFCFLLFQALARFQEVTNRYNQEKQSVDELLKQRDSIHSSFTIVRTPSNIGNGSGSNIPVEESRDESTGEDGSSDGKDKSSKKKWFNLNLKGSDSHKRMA
ncbi:hypothetical protein Dimus_014681 [Dionaea muscipula]